MNVLLVESGTALRAFGAASMTKAKPITAPYQPESRGTGRELARLPIDGQRRSISDGHPILIPKTEIKCSESVTSTQRAQLGAGLATLSRIPLQKPPHDSLSRPERQYELSLLFRSN